MSKDDLDLDWHMAELGLTRQNNVGDIRQAIEERRRVLAEYKALLARYEDAVDTGTDAERLQYHEEFIERQRQRLTDVRAKLARLKPLLDADPRFRALRHKNYAEHVEDQQFCFDVLRERDALAM